jgi:hypothetical protein
MSQCHNAERIYAMYQKILGMAFEPREGIR